MARHANPVIRSASLADAPRVVPLLVAQLREHAIPVSEPHVVATVAAMSAHPDHGLFLVADGGESLVGVAYVSFARPLEHAGEVAWLEELYVVPDARSAGIGGRLVAEVAARAEARGCVSVELEVMRGHDRAANLYRRSGFHDLARSHFARPLAAWDWEPMSAPSPDAVSHVDTFGGYDAWAPDYDTFDNPLIAMAERALASAGESVAGLRVVEFGCGTGRNAKRFLDGGAREYVGIDGSEQMLAVARDRFPGDARVRFSRADFRSETIDGVRDFDLVFFCLVLEHVEDLHGALAAAQKVTTRGARLRALELHAELRDAGTRAHFVAGGNERTLPSFSHSKDEYRRALEATGWELEHATDWHATSSAIQSCRKLEKHIGRPVIVDVAARRR